MKMIVIFDTNHIDYVNKYCFPALDKLVDHSIMMSGRFGRIVDFDPWRIGEITEIKHVREVHVYPQDTWKDLTPTENYFGQQIK